MCMDQLNKLIPSEKAKKHVFTHSGISTETHRQGQQYGGQQKAGVWEGSEGDRAKYSLETEDNLGGGHTLQCTDLYHGSVHWKPM